MLAGADTISALAAFFGALPAAERPFLVLDPVMVSTSGHTLLSADAATGVLISQLLPLVHLVTPNVPEAVAMCGFGRPVATLADMLALAAELRRKTGVASVLLKGGHVALDRTDVRAGAAAQGLDVCWDEDDEGEDIEVLADFRSTLNLPASAEVVVDILFDDKVRLFVGKKVDTTSTHGTGCTLSAALASVYATEKARGRKDLPKAISHEGAQLAISYTQSAIASAHPLGRGHGPLNHSHLSTRRALPP
jgi:hydroxymethylpyrimidine/phosphomethylpyrimidine kinase